VINFELRRLFIETMLCDLDWVFLRNNFKNLNDSFVSKIVPIVKEYFQVDWFKNQTSSWNTYYQPEFTEVLTKRGFGFAFNMLPNSKLFTDRYSVVSDSLTSPILLPDSRKTSGPHRKLSQSLMAQQNLSCSLKTNIP
jgi:hypothetical protein